MVQGKRLLNIVVGLNMPWFLHGTASQIKQALSLNENDNTAILLDYSAMLIGGMYGTTREAEAVKLCLFECEQIARLSIAGIREQASHDPIKVHNCIVRTLATIAKTPKGAEREEMWAALEGLTGKRYPRPRQLGLAFSRPDGPEDQKQK
ncbi:MAG: hypothetical protein ABSC19_19765 [Syntrophorhabdales bacterium]